MQKLELLKEIHEFIWRDDDLMDQDTLFDLQDLVDREVISEACSGRLKISQSPNGFIKSIKIPEAQTPESYFVGDFGQCWIGMRTNMTLEVSREAADANSNAFESLQVLVRAYLRADIQLAHPKHFAVITGITAS